VLPSSPSGCWDPRLRSTPQRSDHPDLGTLVSLGIGLGEPFSSGETDEDYAVRVFNVANVISRDS
jgi:hypothetical protein